MAGALSLIVATSFSSCDVTAPPLDGGGLGMGGNEDKKSMTGRASCLDPCFLCLFGGEPLDCVTDDVLGVSGTHSVKDVTEAAKL